MGSSCRITGCSGDQNLCEILLVLIGIFKMVYYNHISGSRTSYLKQPGFLHCLIETMLICSAIVFFVFPHHFCWLICLDLNMEKHLKDSAPPNWSLPTLLMTTRCYITHTTGHDPVSKVFWRIFHNPGYVGPY